MGWIRLEELLPHHRKVVALGAQAPAILGWYTASVAFANRHFTDGVILPGDLPLLIPAIRPAKATLERLVQARLWDERPDGGWVIHDFLDHNVSAAQRRLRLRADSDRKRLGSQKASLNGVHAESSRSPDVEKSSSREEKSTSRELPPPIVPLAGFARFWAAYPKRVGKGKAVIAWKKAKAEPLIETILAALQTQEAYLQRDGGKYVPNPATWLNERRWEDEPPTDAVHAKTKANTAGVAEWLRQQQEAR